MKFFIRLLLLLSSPGLVQAQIYNNSFLNIPSDPSNNKTWDIQFCGSYNISSNSITNKLFDNYSSSVYINDAAKSSTLKYLKDNNIFGGYQTYNLFCAHKSSIENLSFYLDYSSRTQNGGVFSSDFYKLAFFGNSGFAGKTVVLDGFKDYSESYSSLQFGFYKYFPKSSGAGFMFGAGLSAIAGQTYSSLNIRKGSFYTSPSGDSVVFDANLSADLVTYTPKVIMVNGIGASLNLFGAYRFANNNEIRFQVADLGFVHWFNYSDFTINHKFTYTGEDVNTVNGQFNVSGYHLFFDSLSKTYQAHNGSGSLLTVLPFQLRLTYMQQLGNNLSITEALEYINDGIQKPEISISAAKRFSDRIAIRAGFSLLGYGTFGITAGADWKINDNLSLILGTQHFEGCIFLPDNHGQGMYFSLKWTK